MSIPQKVSEVLSSLVFFLGNLIPFRPGSLLMGGVYTINIWTQQIINKIPILFIKTIRSRVSK